MRWLLILCLVFLTVPSFGKIKKRKRAKKTAYC